MDTQQHTQNTSQTELAPQQEEILETLGQLIEVLKIDPRIVEKETIDETAEKRSLDTEIIEKTIAFSKALYILIPDPTNADQDTTYLLPNDEKLWKSGLTTLSLIHHFFKYQPELNLKLTHAQLQQAWVYQARNKAWIITKLQTGLETILQTKTIPDDFEISEICLIWDYVIHHHRVALITQHLGILETINWNSLIDRYAFIMQIITVGEAFKGMPTSLHQRIIKVLRHAYDVDKTSEDDANLKIQSIITLRNEFAHMENPAFHNKWCDLFHGETLKVSNKKSCINSLEVLQAIYIHQHLLSDHEVEIHYQNALFRSLEQSPQQASGKPEWLNKLFAFERSPNNKTSKKVTALPDNPPNAYSNSGTHAASLEESQTSPSPTKAMNIKAEDIRLSIQATPSPNLQYTFNVARLDEDDLLEKRIALYQELRSLHEIIRNRRKEEFLRQEPFVGLESGFIKLMEAEKLLVVLTGSLLRSVINLIPQARLTHSDTEAAEDGETAVVTAKNTIKLRNNLAHKASLFQQESSSMVQLGNIHLPNINPA